MSGAKLGSKLLEALGFLREVAEFVADWIGRSTLLDDAEVAKGHVLWVYEQLSSVPDIVPALMMIVGVVAWGVIWWYKRRKPMAVTAGGAMTTPEDDKRLTFNPGRDQYVNTGTKTGHIGPVNFLGPQRIKYAEDAEDEVFEQIKDIPIQDVFLIGGPLDIEVAAQYLKHFQRRGLQYRRALAYR